MQPEFAAAKVKDQDAEEVEPVLDTHHGSAEREDERATQVQCLRERV
jgi:hypothetical protein